MATHTTVVVVFLSCLLLVSISPASSDATCPIDVMLRLDSCSQLAKNITGGSSGNPPTAQCCAVLGSVSSQEAADCLCVVLKGDLSGDIDATLGKVLSICQIIKPPSCVCV